MTKRKRPKTSLVILLLTQVNIKKVLSLKTLNTNYSSIIITELLMTVSPPTKPKNAGNYPPIN